MFHTRSHIFNQHAVSGISVEAQLVTNNCAECLLSTRAYP
jgi:hypothetical protein